MAKKAKPAPEPEKDYEDVLYRMPRVLYDEATKRGSVNGMSVQNLITLGLSDCWNVPQPPLRVRGGNRKTKK